LINCPSIRRQKDNWDKLVVPDLLDDVRNSIWVRPKVDRRILSMIAGVNEWSNSSMCITTIMPELIDNLTLFRRIKVSSKKGNIVWLIRAWSPRKLVSSRLHCK